MSKDRNIDDAELANVSGAGAGGGNIHIEATPDVPENDPPGIFPPPGGGGGGGSIEGDADTGGDQELNRD